MSTRFAGQITVVAGGTGGLGRAVTQAFLDEGATVIVTYRTQAEFNDLVRTVAANASRLEGQRVDVTDETESRRFIEGTLAQHKRLDALVNTVGGYVGGVKLWDLDAKVLDQMLALNLRSGYELVTGGRASNAEARTWFDRKHRRQGSVRSPCWRGGVRRFKGRGDCDD